MQEFEWDIEKAATNWREHGIRFDEAASVFRDPFRRTFPDPCRTEDRLRTIGMAADGAMLYVVYTIRGEGVIRIISARRAEPRERRLYGNREV